ncbi:MAG: 30S ribosomal protein S20 [Candidatus Aureabacteria bacterium]|nr:30S ribosomal protein S20 [Candidatus Auribacterota bacterium]
MPNLKASKKHVRQTKKQTERNKGIKSELRTEKKKLLELISSKDKEKSEILLKKVSSKFDTAAKKNILHKKNADRNKSRLSKKVSALAK